MHRFTILVKNIDLHILVGNSQHYAVFPYKFNSCTRTCIHVEKQNSIRNLAQTPLSSARPLAAVLYLYLAGSREVRLHVADGTDGRGVWSDVTIHV